MGEARNELNRLFSLFALFGRFEGGEGGGGQGLNMICHPLRTFFFFGRLAFPSKRPYGKGEAHGGFGYHWVAFRNRGRQEGFL